MSPGTCEHNSIWKQGLYKQNKVKIRLHWIKVGPNPMAGVLVRGGKSGHTETDTWRRRPCEGGDRDWSEMSRSQHMASIMSNTRN